MKSKSIALATATCGDTKNDLADGSGKIDLLTVGRLGAESAVNLVFYARDNDYAAELPVFRVVVDSFRFDPGSEFRPLVKETITWQTAVSWILFAIFAGLFAAGVRIVRKNRRNRPMGF